MTQPNNHEGFSHQDLIAAYAEIEELQRRGLLDYDEMKLKHEFQAFKAPWFRRYLAVAALFSFAVLVLFIWRGAFLQWDREFFGMFCAVLCFGGAIAALDGHRMKADRFQTVARMYLSGELGQSFRSLARNEPPKAALATNPQLSAVAAPMAQLSAADELAKLHELYKQGALSEAEFHEAKRRVLAT